MDTNPLADVNAVTIVQRLTDDKVMGRVFGALMGLLRNYEAVGPFVQGLRKPYCDLSRGCSADDIFGTMCITALQS